MDRLDDAIEALQASEVRHLPVVDREGELVGMLSDRDVGAALRPFTEGAEARRDAEKRARLRVSDVMSADVKCVNVDDDVDDLVEAMLEQHVGALPVVDGDGAIVGIVSYVDVLRELGASFPRTNERSRS